MGNLEYISRVGTKVEAIYFLIRVQRRAEEEAEEERKDRNRKFFI